jgi:hypothetical protein
LTRRATAHPRYDTRDRASLRGSATSGSAGLTRSPVRLLRIPVHGEFPVATEEARVSEGADGSTSIKITGSLEEAVTNVETGKTITFNASGPGTATISPDATTVTQDSQGVSGLYAPNLTQFGFPSNFVQVSGLLLASYDLASGAIISMPTPPHVELDVCVPQSGALPCL